MALEAQVLSWSCSSCSGILEYNFERNGNIIIASGLYVVEKDCCFNGFIEYINNRFTGRSIRGVFLKIKEA